MSPEEIRAHMKKIEDRAWPIVVKEFAKFTEGEVTPLAHELLQDPDAMALGRPVLNTQIQTYSPDTKIKAWNTAFQASPDTLRTEIILHSLRYLPKEMFYTKEVQEWLVGKINGGIPAGVYYLILTDESARTVTETAKASMKQLSERQVLFPILSAVFLVTRGDEDALKLLDSLLDKRDVNSPLERHFVLSYVIPAAAMTGNDKLIRKLCDIIRTDKQSVFDVHDNTVDFPFADRAARMCALTIEGFPPLVFWEDDNEGLIKNRKVVHDWMDKNPKFEIKSDFAFSIIRQTVFQSVITEMLKHDEKQSNKKQ